MDVSFIHENMSYDLKKRKEQGMNISGGLCNAWAEQRCTIKFADLETKEVTRNRWGTGGKGQEKDQWC